MGKPIESHAIESNKVNLRREQVKNISEPIMAKIIVCDKCKQGGGTLMHNRDANGNVIKGYHHPTDDCPPPIDRPNRYARRK